MGKSEEVKTDCRHFKGYMPCKPHKQKGYHCNSCPEYEQIQTNILIIKLGRAGEVIRNTPLLHRLRKDYPEAKISWLSEYPALIPKKMVDEIIPFKMENIFPLLTREFDLVLSLDKDAAACTFAKLIHAEKKKGFTINEHGGIIPIDQDAEEKWLTGIFDDLMKKNKKHYVQEIFEICGLPWNEEEYILPEFREPNSKTNLKTNINKTIALPKDKPIIGFNTGAGDTWKTRVLSDQKTKEVILALQQRGYEVLLLGGPDEDEKNKKFANETNAQYYGTFPFEEFIGLANKCDLILTGVTMALHIAIGLKKKVILLNNIFPTNEFYLYNRGEILEPDLPCKYCYKPRFDEKCPTTYCMDLISTEKIIQTVDKLLMKESKNI